MAVRCAPSLGTEDFEDDNEGGPVIEAVVVTLPAFLLHGETEELTVVLSKETDSTRIGIGLPYCFSALCYDTQGQVSKSCK